MASSAEVFVDKRRHLHFYSTYLAARLAGMAHGQAHRLAEFCRVSADLVAGEEATRPWSYQGRRFVPCVVAGNDVKSLAFARLPAFESFEQTDSRALVPCQAERSCADETPPQLHAYNPLSDVDWQGGGGFKASFARKIAIRLAMFSAAEETPSQSTVTLDRLPPALQSQANSAFSRKMLNDSLRVWTEQGIDRLALFGCRLFVYQRTWCQALEHDDEQPREAAAQRLLEAFYWTLYAIECFVKGTCMADKLHISRRGWEIDVGLLSEALTGLYGFDGDSVEVEYLWLERLPHLLAGCGLSVRQQQQCWWQGFRYCSGQMLEMAMIQSGAGISRQIRLLRGFTDSDFFKLNKAAEYQADWVDAALQARGFDTLNVRQCCGDDELWQL